MSPSAVIRCTALIAIRPSLWATAWRQYRSALPRRWWKRRPFVPIPPADYVRFRLQTQYGDADHHIATVDVINYLLWCKLQRAVAC